MRHLPQYSHGHAINDNKMYMSIFFNRRNSGEILKLREKKALWENLSREKIDLYPLFD